MSITNYSELKSSIANWLHRTDLDAVIPDFIALAEAQITADIRSRMQQVRTNLTATSGNAYVTIPTDFVEMQRLIVTGTNPAQVLKYISPDELTQDYADGRVGIPQVFTVIGQQIQLAPVPDSNYTLEMTYYQRIPALSDSNPTNWVLTNWPNAYLYGALVAAQPWLVNDDRVPLFQALYQQAVTGIDQIDWYSGTTLRVRAT